MSSSRTSPTVVASRYATAIFALAAEAGQEESVVAEISALAGAVAHAPELLAALKSPLLPRAAKAQMLAALAKQAGKLTQQSLATIAAQGRAALLPRIAEVLREKLAAARGEITAQVESARPLSAAAQKQLAASLAKATGKTVQLALKENPELLGGVAIQIGSKRLDASLSAALATMRRELLAAPTNA